MPRRIDGAIVGGDQRSRRRGARRTRDARRQREPGAAERRLRRAVFRTFRQDHARPRLHQGLPTGPARKRRPVHARLDLVADRIRDAGRRRQGQRTAGNLRSDPEIRYARKTAALQGRALRRMRGRLFGRAARGPRWLDVVFGLRRLAVSRDRGMGAGLARAGRPVARRALHPAQVEGLPVDVSAWRHGLGNRGRKPRPRLPRGRRVRIGWCNVAGFRRRHSACGRWRHPPRSRRHAEGNELMPTAKSDAFVFFGATGDLAYKQIFPALQALIKDGKLDMPVIGIARSGWTVDDLRKRAEDSLKEHGGIDKAAFAKLSKQMQYLDGDYGDASTYEKLRKALGDAEH